jgi:formylglycine-generating enzyme required for sulfatase activity
MPDASPAEKLKVFISYSRRDAAEFADELVAGLELAGFAPFLDRQDIAAGEDWEARLGGLIAQSDTVVFVLSPEAIKSERCRWEVDRTLALSKRILPVIHKPVPDADIPSQLSRLQFVRFDTGRALNRSLAELAEALRVDLDWIREHTRLGELAARWNARGRPDSLFLRGDDLDSAKVWAAARKPGAPEITEVQRALLQASDEWETSRLSHERKQLEEMRRALEQTARSQRRTRRLTWGIGALMLATIASLLGVIFKEEIGGLVFQYTTVRRYIAANFTAYVLTADAERALKPGDPFRECAKECPEMVVVPAGVFRMGSPDSEPDRLPSEGPVHTVTITRPFAVGRFEVTWDEWGACVAMRGCDGRPTGDAGYEKGHKPVINVTWDQAKAYTAWLSRMTGKPYRLLTEAEWEYAARGVTSVDAVHGPFPWGDDPLYVCRHANVADLSFRRARVQGDIANCDDGHAFTAPVGSFPANSFGLHDMHGNVWEWVEDGWHSSYAGNLPSDGSEWKDDADTSRHVVRGGSWYDWPGASARPCATGTPPAAGTPIWVSGSLGRLPPERA